MNDRFGMKLIQAIRVTVRACMRMSTKDSAHDQYASNEQAQIGAGVEVQGTDKEAAKRLG